MAALEIIKAIANLGILVVIAGMYLYQNPKMIEKVTKVVENNTSVIQETRKIHDEMKKDLIELKNDVEDIKLSTNMSEVLKVVERIEYKIDSLGKDSNKER